MGSSPRSEDGSPTKKLTATAAPGDGIISCGYYDVQLVQHISKALLLSLGAACIETDPASNNLKSVAADTKNELVEFVTQKCGRYVKESDGDDPVQVIERFLANFVRSKRPLLRKMSSRFLGSSSRDDRMDRVVSDLDRLGIWPIGRRDSVARVLLKQLVDQGMSGHVYCEQRFNSSEELMLHKVKCGFRPVDCPSHGCDAILSTARLTEHDSVCLFKLLSCEQSCRAMVMRGEMDMHCASACNMRPVPCPFSFVGCPKKVSQTEIQRHCEQDMGSHLLSLLQSLQKLDGFSSSHSQRLVLLEKAVCIAQRFEGMDIASLILTLRDQETKIQGLEQELSKVRQEVKATDVSAEVLQLRRELRSLQRRIDS